MNIRRFLISIALHTCGHSWVLFRWCNPCLILSYFSLGLKVLEFPFNARRGGTLNRKHASPAFHPPLPPNDGGTQAEPAGTPTDVTAANSYPAQPAVPAEPVSAFGQEEAR